VGDTTYKIPDLVTTDQRIQEMN